MGEEVLSLVIPRLLNHVLELRARDAKWHEEDLAFVRGECESRVSTAIESEREAIESEREVVAENERLREELSRAETRIESLLEVIKMLK